MCVEWIGTAYIQKFWSVQNVAGKSKNNSLVFTVATTVIHGYGRWNGKWFDLVSQFKEEK